MRNSEFFGNKPKDGLLVYLTRLIGINIFRRFSVGNFNERGSESSTSVDTRVVYIRRGLVHQLRDLKGVLSPRIFLIEGVCLVSMMPITKGLVF
jgi:hypothetical protein